MPDAWTKRPRLILDAALAVFALYFFAGPGLQGPRERSNRPKSPFYGLYQVEAFRQNGKPLTQNDSNWRQVIFEQKGDMTVLAMDDSMHYYGADVDAAKNAVTISGEYAELPSRLQGDANSDNRQVPKSILTYWQADPDHLEFRGNLASQPVVIDMRRIDTSKFTLISRGFHWVENGGFYR
jgi:hypothetical protein